MEARLTWRRERRRWGRGVETVAVGRLVGDHHLVQRFNRIHRVKLERVVRRHRHVPETENKIPYNKQNSIGGLKGSENALIPLGQFVFIFMRYSGAFRRKNSQRLAFESGAFLRLRNSGSATEYLDFILN